MRKEPTEKLESSRRRHGVLGAGKGMYGYFIVSVNGGGAVRIISSGSADDWEHVSASVANRIPTWGEMCVVKDLFWGPDETVIQFHPKEAQYVNHHPHTLHLWKKAGEEYELPPTIYV